MRSPVFPNRQKWVHEQPPTEVLILHQAQNAEVEIWITEEVNFRVKNEVVRTLLKATHQITVRVAY